MLPFSTFAAQFPGVSSRVVKTTTRAKPSPRETRMIHIQTTASGAFDMLNMLLADNAEFREYVNDRDLAWAGFESGETPRQFLADRVLRSALEKAKAAKARVNAPLTRAAPQPAFIGPAFSIGRLLQGHPKACYTRPRAKLPPKSFALYSGYSWTVDESTLAPVFASIAKGITDYTLRGGIATVRLAFIYGFRKPNAGHDGVIFSVDIPASNTALLSGICSTAFGRGLVIPLAKTLSGYRDDSLPVLKIANGLQVIGKPTDDSAMVASLGLTATP
jgi:hypothetical protein